MISEAVLVVLITVLQVTASVMIFRADGKKLKQLEGCNMNWTDERCYGCDNMDSDQNGCYCILDGGGTFDDEGRCKDYVRGERTDCDE